MKYTSSKTGGFTLIEILVSVAIFSVVMVIALGALLAMSSADRKAEAVKSIVNNLNFALDSMSRTIRTGTGYNCNTSAGGDCATTGGTTLYLTSSSGAPIAYRLENTTTDPSAATVCNQPSGAVGCIAVSQNGGAWTALTAPEVVIAPVNNYLFYLRGSKAGSGDNEQPIVTIELSGYTVVNGGVSSESGCFTSGVSNGLCSVFNLQTSVTQRIYDQ